MKGTIPPFSIIAINRWVCVGLGDHPVLEGVGGPVARGRDPGEMAVETGGAVQLEDREETQDIGIRKYIHNNRHSFLLPDFFLTVTLSGYYVV